MEAAEVSEALICEQLDAEAGEEPATVFEIKLHNRGLERVGAALAACAKLKVLDLSFNKLRHIDGLAALGELRELRLYCNQLSRLSGLHGCTSLQVLQLHGNQLGDRPLGPNPTRDDGLGRLSALHTLSLDRNPLTDAGLIALQLHANTQLTTLRVSATRITSLAPLARCGRLETLEANGNAICSLEGATAAWGALVELQLSGNRIADLRPLRSLRRLAVLHLNSNGLRSITRLPPLPALVELQLSANQLESIAPLAPRAPIADVAGAAERDPAPTDGSGAQPAPRAPRPGVRPGSRPSSAMPAPSAHAGEATRAGAARKAEPTKDSGGACAFPSLEVLDVSRNQLADLADACAALRALPELAELRLSGNPLCTHEALGTSLGSALGERLRVLDDVELVDAQRSGETAAARGDAPGARPRTPGVDASSCAASSTSPASSSTPTGGRPASACVLARPSKPNAGGGALGAIPLVRPPSSRALLGEKTAAQLAASLVQAAAHGSGGSPRGGAADVGAAGAGGAAAADEIGLLAANAQLEHVRKRLRQRLDDAKASIGAPKPTRMQPRAQPAADHGAAVNGVAMPPLASKAAAARADGARDSAANARSLCVVADTAQAPAANAERARSVAERKLGRAPDEAPLAASADGAGALRPARGADTRPAAAPSAAGRPADRSSCAPARLRAPAQQPAAAARGQPQPPSTGGLPARAVAGAQRTAQQPAAPAAPVVTRQAASTAAGAAGARAAPAPAPAAPPAPAAKARLDAARIFAKRCSSDKQTRASAAAALAVGATVTGAALDDARAEARPGTAAAAAAELHGGVALALALREPLRAAQVLVLEESRPGCVERPSRFALMPAGDAAALSSASATDGVDGAAEDGGGAGEAAARAASASGADARAVAEAARAHESLLLAGARSARHAPAASGAYASFRLPLRESAAFSAQPAAGAARASLYSPRGLTSCAPAKCGGGVPLAHAGAIGGVGASRGGTACRPSSAGQSKVLERAKLSGGVRPVLPST
ncbi:hypothetical protein KFE25_003036 [Diacronema lutheri]|uniref:Protein phosphatase 1 regulatory subunit 7 n=1 Tax=Diacronema lutheri TaxID=2081491 RepID=A0A8J5X1P0_DIALT|nr:hypothetical protein KFE25_003036 [Diacronema lutheri]